MGNAGAAGGSAPSSAARLAAAAACLIATCKAMPCQVSQYDQGLHKLLCGGSVVTSSAAVCASMSCTMHRGALMKPPPYVY